MSERGVFAVDRGIWSDPDFADEQFSEREAFLWMLSEAAWRPTKVRIGANVVDLARGQLAFSTRFMAAKWKWSEARVRRFLGRLISAEIVCTTTDKIATHVTILKYDRFQRVSLPDTDVPTHTRRTSDAPATHPRRKEEDREYTEDKEVISSLRSESAPAAPSPRKRKIDPNWQLGADEIAAAEQSGVSELRARQIWPDFIDRHVHQGTLGLDWLRGWRTWCRKDVEFNGRAGRQKQRPPPRSLDGWAGDAIKADAELTGGRYDNRPLHRDTDTWDRPGEPGGVRSYEPAAQQAGADTWGVPALRLVGSR
jgi:hypothetical protein